MDPIAATSSNAPHQPSHPQPIDRPGLTERIQRKIFGPPRDLKDRSLFHRLTLVAFLAWVGLGADGLSSAAYGPSEAFLALGPHTYLALIMAIVTPLTVMIIATAYARIIEAFPQGGGGYVVATSLLGPAPGVVSGCALVIDYVLTITVSIAAAGEAIFSMLPPEWRWAKIPAEIVLIAMGVTVNIRGVREAVLPLVPIFLLFVITHAMLIFGAIIRDLPNAGQTAGRIADGFQTGWAELGLWGMFILFVRAYSLGAGTYTGIEAVSNGLNFMREPRVQTAKRTMLYMAVSLAATAGGLLIAFLLSSVHHVEGKTLNAVLAERVASGIPGGNIFVWCVLISEAFILVVAAQTGFIGGPRVLATMAVDGWVPRRFASLSDRLTSQNGIIMLGIAAAAALLLARGHLTTLILIYTINVFISFTLSMASMVRHSLRMRRERHPAARKNLTLFSIGLAVCLLILLSTSIIRFTEEGWAALTVTALFTLLCFRIRYHYRKVRLQVAQLERIVDLPKQAGVRELPAPDPKLPTAVILVGGYNGLGIHTAMASMQAFRGFFKNLVFVSVGQIDSSAFKSPAEMDAVTTNTRESLERYVKVAHQLGVPAAFRFAIGTDPVDELEKLCPLVAKEFPNASFFAGKLIFQRERWYHHILHNQTAFVLQRRLQWAGIPVLILPIRVR